MLTRRETFKLIAVALGCAALPEAALDRAVELAAPRANRLEALVVEAWSANRGRVFLGLPGMDVRNGEGVFCWLDPGLSVSLALGETAVFLEDIAVEAERKGDKAFLMARVDGNLSMRTVLAA